MSDAFLHSLLLAAALMLVIEGVVPFFEASDISSSINTNGRYARQTSTDDRSI